MIRRKAKVNKFSVVSPSREKKTMGICAESFVKEKRPFLLSSIQSVRTVALGSTGSCDRIESCFPKA